MVMMIVAFCGVTAISILLRPTTMPASTAALAVLIAALGFVPVVHFLRLPADARPAFPLFALTGVFYALFFGLSAFAAELLRGPETGISPLGVKILTSPPTNDMHFYWRVLIAGISAKTQLLVVVGMVTMSVGYIGFRSWALCLPQFYLPSAFDARRMRLAFWLFLVAHVAYISVPAVRQVASIGQLLQPAGTLAFGGLYILWRRRELHRFETVALFVLLFLECALILRTTSLTPILLMAVLLLALEFTLTRRIPWLRMLAFGAAMVVLYPTIQAARPLIWKADIEIGLLSTPIIIVRSLFGMKLLDRKAQSHVDETQYNVPHPFLGRSYDDALKLSQKLNKPVSVSRGRGLVRRISHVVLMEHVVANTPSRIPYWKGETYRPLLTSWIPRFLWPGKPQEMAGWTFGLRYGMLRADEPPQSINLPWMIEMYANFGGPGVILGMGLVGVLFAFLEAFLSRPSMTPAEMAAGTAVILPLFMQDSNFSLMTGSIPLLIVAFWIVLAVAAKIPLPSVLSKDRPGS